ncbi:hypothetical protein BV898_00971 [Hypsibius exemplaris]|uniref:Uncharacterized protein n=1 Tax=Hypsibius exemplaris TaxID=2072580 RepID=A0A1W0XD14_HYPEX|nr:hypothetical protein BV898_00971 [Hypsibius exemplaris]
MMFPTLTVFCVIGLVYGQSMTGEDQTPDRLQMYQVLDEKADQILQMAQDLGAAVEALRAGRAREFLKGSMAVPLPNASGQQASDSPVDGSRFQGPLGSSFGPLEAFPLMSSPVSTISSDVKQGPEGARRSKRSYYGRSRYGGYGGYGRSYGGYGGYGRGYGGYGGYGRSYGGYGSRYYG